MSSDLITPTPLRVVSTAQEDLVILRVAGEIDIATCAALDEAIDSSLAGRPRAIALDLSEVSFLACAGASSILESWYRATKQRTRLGIVNPSAAAERVLHAMRLDAVLVRDPSIISGTTRSY